MGLALVGCVAGASRQDLCSRATKFAAGVLANYGRLSASSPAHAHMTQQLFRAAASIGANLEEGRVANSRRDMALKYAIALREARESHYWIRLFSSDPEWTAELRPLLQEANEFVAMLTTSVRKLRQPPL